MTIGHAGKHYLIAANYSDAVVEAKLPVLFNQDRLNVWFENRTIPVKTGVVAESFNPFEVHIYTNALQRSLDRLPAPENWLRYADQLQESITGERKQLIYWIKAPAEKQFERNSLACFIRQFEISSPLAQAVLVAASSEPAEIFRSGKVIGKLPGNYQPIRLDILTELSIGINSFGIRFLTGGKANNSIAAELRIRHFSGEITVISSNDEWRFVKMGMDEYLPEFDQSFPAAMELYRLERGLQGKNLTWPETEIK